MKENQIEDESWYPDKKIEWWFVQGFFEGGNIPREYFMVSFFRQLLRDPEPHHGYTLISSLFNPETSENKVITWIDNDIFKWILRKTDKVEKLKPYFNEIKTFGPLPPVMLKNEKPEMAGNTLSVSWDNFLLSQTEEGFKLRLPGTLLNSRVQFNARPMTGCFTTMQEKDSGKIRESMSYNTYPLCELSGMIGENKITGRAWLDHQWGGYGMFVSEDESREGLKGWNWFGISLEDNSSWIIWEHWYLKTGKKITTSATRMNFDGTLEHFDNIDVAPLRLWESPLTGASYPVECEIKIPQKNISMIFSPVFDNQEIVLYGPHRSVWEGCGRVVYRDGYCAINGYARGEFFGQGYIHNLKTYFLPIENRIKNNIKAFFPEKPDGERIEHYIGKTDFAHSFDAYTKTVSEPVWNLMNREGKMWRPVFSLLMLESLGCNSKNFESILSVFPEMSHTGSLIIDDIEDHSLLRRGEKSIHEKYGMEVAINAANTIYFLPFLELINHRHLTPVQKTEIYEVLIRGYISGHLGQAADIFWSNNMTPENLDEWLNTDLENQILQVYSAKTGSILKGSAATAGIIANTDEKTKEACIEFAQNVSIAFQILDDIRNFNPEISRKKCGEDISEGKLTYIIIKALLTLDKKHKEYISKILCDPLERGQKTNINAIIELVNSTGILEQAQRKASDMFHSSWSRLCMFTQHSESRIMLKLLCHKLLDL